MEILPNNSRIFQAAWEPLRELKINENEKKLKQKSCILTAAINNNLFVNWYSHVLHTHFINYCNIADVFVSITATK